MLDVERISKATADDLAENPKLYGLPTLEEFAKDPSLYTSAFSASDLMAQIDRGSQQLNRHVTGHEYYVGTYRCESLEKAERMMADMGFNASTRNMKPEVIDEGAGKCKIKVTFELPDE